MRAFAIGDIHGHLAFLDLLLTRLQTMAEPGDSLVFVGDYIDRGPDSAGVIDRVLELRRGAWEGPVVCLRGNHEDMLLDCLREQPRYDHGLWLENGGQETLDSYFDRAAGEYGAAADLTEILPAAHLEFLQSLPYHHEDEHAWYVHAGFARGAHPVEATTDQEMLWLRSTWIDAGYGWGKPVVFGHTPQFEGMCRGRGPQTNWQPLNRPEKIGIDTGVCYGGALSAVVLPSREFVTISEVKP